MDYVSIGALHVRRLLQVDAPGPESLLDFFFCERLSASMARSLHCKP